MEISFVGVPLFCALLTMKSALNDETLIATLGARFVGIQLNAGTTFQNGIPITYVASLANRVRIGNV